MIKVSRNFVSSIKKIKNELIAFSKESDWTVDGDEIKDAPITRAWNADTDSWDDELRLTLTTKDRVVLKPSTYKAVPVDPIVTIECEEPDKKVAQYVLDTLADRLGES